MLIQERYEKLQAENFKEISDLQSDVARLEIANREYSKDIRELEQQNDDLDRTNRFDKSRMPTNVPRCIALHLNATINFCKVMTSSTLHKLPLFQFSARDSFTFAKHAFDFFICNSKLHKAYNSL